jgi:valyl-tRNA synthetase
MPEVLAVAAAVLGEIRRAKSEAKRSMRAPVASVTVTDTPDRLALLAPAEADVRSAGNVASLETIEGETFSVEVRLATEG